MKLHLEQKSKVVENLHSIRVKNESEHVTKMKSVKQEWKKRLEGVNGDNDKVSRTTPGTWVRTELMLFQPT